MFDTVVVPVGYRDDVGDAVAHGATLARQAGASLELLTVPPTYVAATDVHRHLVELAERHAVDAKLRVTAPADPAGFIATTATEPGTVICMQTHARGPIGELVLGSVSEHVVRISRRPIVLVGPHCEAPPEHYGSLVAALDGSDFAEQILPTLKEWSTALGLTPWLFEVLHGYVPFEAGLDEGHETAYVHNLATKLREQGTDWQWETAHDRHPAEAIVRFAEAHRPGLVAMTTHGQSPVGRMALGGVAFQVARDAPMPVLVLRPDDPGAGG